MTQAHNAHFVGNDKLLFGMVLGVLTFWLFYQSMFNLAPDIQRDLQMSDSSLGAVISLGSLFSGCFIVLMGGFADKFGRVKMTFIGFWVNILACLVLYFSFNTLSFGIGRILQGMAAACIMPATLSLIKTYYDGTARQRAFSFWSIGSFGGSGLSSFVGGFIGTFFGWKSVFILSIIVSIIGMLLMRGTPETKSQAQTGRYDYVGLFSCVIGLFSLNLFITKGLKMGLTDPKTLALLATFVASFLVFWRTEIRLKSLAFMDFELFKNRAYSGACLSNFLLNTTAGTIFIVNTYLQKGLGLTSFQAGLQSLSYVAMVLIMIRVSERLLRQYGYKNPMLIGLVITIFGILVLSMTQFGAYQLISLIGFAFFGFGLGVYATPAADCVMVNAPQEKSGMAAGIFKMASALGASFGIAVGVMLFSGFAKNGDVHTAGMYALWVMACLGAMAWLVAWILLPKTQKTNTIT